MHQDSTTSGGINEQATPSHGTRRISADVVRISGAIASSCTGTGGAIAIAVEHGNPVVAVALLGVMQTWSACELLFRWRMKWRYACLHEYLIRKAADNPGDEDLRTLLIDFASTQPDELGTRLLARTHLKKLERVTS